MNNRPFNAMLPDRDRLVAEYVLGTSISTTNAAEHFGISASEIVERAAIAGIKRCECCLFWHYEDELAHLGGEDICYDCASNSEVMRDDTD